MSETSQNILTTLGVYDELVPADAVRISITVKSGSLLSGDMNLRAIEEVALLFKDLAQAGIDEDKIQLDSMDARVNQSIVGKSSSASYDLSVVCPVTESLPRVLLSIQALKKASLGRLTWQYTITPDKKSKWLVEAIKLARNSAEAAAEELNVEITGMHYVHEGRKAIPEWEREYAGAMGQVMYSLAPLPLSAQLSHSRKFSTVVEVGFHVIPKTA